MSKLFLIDDELKITYEQLLQDINNKDTYSSYIYDVGNDPYSIFLSIVHSLVYDYPIQLLDGYFSKRDLAELHIDENFLQENKQIETKVTIHSVDALISKVRDVNNNWRLTMYTSGTTGKPKKVSHQFARLTGNVKTGARFSEDIWGFAYNPTHMAGIQVFFQALLNINTIVYLFDYPFDKIAKWIPTYEVTHVSATPTFYRNLLPSLKEDTHELVQVVTLGGEKFDSQLANQLKKTFPEANIRNIYATTETASLFTAQGELFHIEDSIKHLISFTEQNELLIHRNFLGESATYTLIDNWYHTGDIVEFVDDTYFKFISRESDFINVGGYNVNPSEVEAVLRQVPGVQDAVVKSRSSSVTGEIIVADVMKDHKVDGKELKRDIKTYATKHLQRWEIPRLIKYVSEISVSRTGKQVRK